MKKSIRKFAVINGRRPSEKVVLPMNQSALTHILSLSNQSFGMSEDDALTITEINSSYWGERNEKFNSILRMAKGKERYADVRTIKLGVAYRNEYAIRMTDMDAKITDRFFDFIIERTQLKYVEEEGTKVILVDDSLIPEGLTESFVNKGRLVKKDLVAEIFGDRTILRYHHNTWHPEVEKQFTKFMDKTEGAVNFGFEAEKIDYEMVTEGLAMKIAYETGYKKEEDGSLGEDGFELISPILPLYNQEVISESIKPVKDFLNADSNEKCGGHFNISKNGVSSRDILKSLKGSLPILYSIYEKRMSNRFCPTKQFSTYLRRHDKYASCYLKNSNVLEIRLFPAIKNTSMLQNRIDLMRIIMGELSGKTAMGVLTELAKPTSNIHTFMLNTIFDGNIEKFVKKLRLFAKYSEQFGCGKISLACKKRVNKLMQMDVFDIPAPIPVQSIPEEVAEEQVSNDVRQSSVQETTENVSSELTEYARFELTQGMCQFDSRYHNSNDLFATYSGTHELIAEAERVFSSNPRADEFDILYNVLSRKGIVTHMNILPEGSRGIDALLSSCMGFQNMEIDSEAERTAVRSSLKAFYVAEYILRRIFTQRRMEGNNYEHGMRMNICADGQTFFMAVCIDSERNVRAGCGMLGTGVQWIISSLNVQPFQTKRYNLTIRDSVTIVNE